MQSIQKSDITVVILAGGQGRRMGGRDKGLIEFNGKPIIELLIGKLQQQDIQIVINANRNQSVYRRYGYPVVSDELADFQGPLAGFASAMKNVKTRFILTVPCDGPLLADDFIEAFINVQTKSNAKICVADDGERLQPVYALIRTDLVQDLETFLHSGDRKIDRWYAQHNFARVDFSGQKNMFANINRPEDHAALLDSMKS